MNILVHKQPLLLFTYEYKNRNWTFKSIICHLFSTQNWFKVYIYRKFVITSWAITNCFCSCLGLYFREMACLQNLVEMTTLSETRIIMLFMLNECESWLIFHPAAIFKGENIWIGQNNFHVYKILSIPINIFYFANINFGRHSTKNFINILS